MSHPDSGSHSGCFRPGGCHAPRPLGVGAFIGRTTLIAGPGRRSGKTSFARVLARELRMAGERVAFFAVGLEGLRRDGFTGEERPRFRVESGEIVLTAEKFLHATDARFEVFATLPEPGALGVPVLAFVRRAGDAILAGPDRNENLGLALRLAAEEGGAQSCVVDGALNRLTQLASIRGMQLVYSVMLNRGDCRAGIESLVRIGQLAMLPVHEGPDCILVEGPLTAQILEALPAGDRPVVVEDFSRIFLPAGSVSRLLKGRGLAVRRKLKLAAFQVILRGVSQEEFSRFLDREELPVPVMYNPYEAHEVEGTGSGGSVVPGTSAGAGAGAGAGARPGLVPDGREGFHGL